MGGAARAAWPVLVALAAVRWLAPLLARSLRGAQAGASAAGVGGAVGSGAGGAVDVGAVVSGTEVATATAGIDAESGATRTGSG